MVDPAEHGPELPLTEPIAAVASRSGFHVRVFGSRMFFRLWTAQFVSALGDWLGFLAITILAARVGGGSGAAAAVGLVMTARILPGFFLAPLAGVLIDRWDRKLVMVSCDIARAAITVALLFVDTVLGLVVVSLLLEVCTLLWSPAKEASVPNLVPPDRLASANSLSLAAAYGTFPLAALCFALLATLAGWLSGFSALDALEVNDEVLAFYVRILTFLISAGIIWRLPLPHNRRQRATDHPAKGRGRGTLRDLREGWSFIFVNPVVRTVILGLATGLMGGGMVVPLGSVFSIEVLGAGSAGFGAFVTALGVGAAVGVLAVSVTQARLPKKATFTVALFGASASLAAAAAMSSLVLSALFVGGLGVCAGTVYVIGFTLLHEGVDDDLRGRIFSTLYTLVRLCLLLAFAIGPFLSQLLDNASEALLDDRQLGLPGGGELFLPGVRLTLWIAAAIILAAGVVALRSLGDTDRRRRRAASAAAPDLTAASAGSPSAGDPERADTPVVPDRQ
ncbi:MAG: MFS transporter [Acidimicrobiia bacterium]|nr:MFS transporter [Acidimicrobiia bacterium]